jgi:diaminohydroxyphosphoribosylaminopyrimidine deaminase/5-amino-6-(5-phosphoribosylamino)uracil reductase
MTHEHWMQRALELAAQGRGWVNPNPLVGAVIVKKGKIIGEGFHHQYGGPHAEVFALEQAGLEAQGADLYVNVEPCVHRPGKQTPPCTDRLLSQGIRRVFVAMRDPDPHVNGRGIQQLRAAGIAVQEGLLEVLAHKLNEISIQYKTTKKPFVLLKMAISADGKIATRTGQSKYISSAESLCFTHELRDRYAALAVGIDTLIADDPQLTTRLDYPGHNPVRVILDTHGRIPLGATIWRTSSMAKTILATSDAIRPEKEEALRKLGAEIWKLPTIQNREPSKSALPQDIIDLSALLDRLGRSGYDSLLVEGGPTAAAGFLQARLVNKITFLIAPMLIGGASAPSALGGQGIENLEEALKLRDVNVRVLGQEIVYEAYVAT